MRAGIASTLGISVDNSLTPASAGTGKGGTADVPRSCPNLKPANQPASLPAFLSVYLPACLPAYPSVHMSFCPCPPVFPPTSSCLTCKEPTCLSACSPIKHASLAVYVHYLPSFMSSSSLPPSLLLLPLHPSSIHSLLYLAISVIHPPGRLPLLFLSSTFSLSK